MHRVLVLGCPGAGKTTLARRIAAALALPLRPLPLGRRDPAALHLSLEGCAATQPHFTSPLWGEVAAKRRVRGSMNEMPAPSNRRANFCHRWSLSTECFGGQDGSRPRQEFRDAVARLAAMAVWNMLEIYSSTFDLRLPVADTIVFLDLPRRICMWRVIRRTVGGYGRTRVGLLEDCPERFNWEFLNYVWNFHAAHRPQFAAALANSAGHAHVHRLESPDAAERFLTKIERR